MTKIKYLRAASSHAKSSSINHENSTQKQTSTHEDEKVSLRFCDMVCFSDYFNLNSGSKEHELFHVQTSGL